MDRPHGPSKQSIKKDKEKSKFIKYCVNTTLCLFICCIGFVFLIFRTNTLYDIDTISSMPKSIQHDISVSQTVSATEDTATNPNTPGVLPEMSDWYSEVPSSIRNKGSVVDTLSFSDGNINLYNSLPWDYAEGCYMFNVNQAGEDVINWVNTVAGVDSGLSVNTQIAYLCSSQSCITTIDGVDVLRFAPPPALTTMDYCNAFSDDVTKWYTDPEPDDIPMGYVSAYQLSWLSTDPAVRNRKYCVILESKDNGNIYYMPLGTSDCKAHTFPGGVLQTDLKLLSAPNGPTGEVTCNLGDVVDKTFTIKYLAENADTFQTRPGRENSTVKDYFKSCLEIYGGCTSDCTILYQYTIKGYICWPLGV